MENDQETVTLLVNNTALKCNKQQLIDNSNYFKVMFEGNFAERNQDIVTLEEIDFNSFQLLLNLLVDQPTAPYLLSEEELLQLLQTVCMLQFEKIQEICLTILTERLNPQNCIKIWFICQSHGVNPLYLKAKNLSLIEFNVIKDTNALLDFDLVQLHSYLANVMLQCRCELDVFTVCMQWYYENGEGDVKSLIKLLSCVDFSNASHNEMREMMMMPDVHNNKVLCDILHQISRLKLNAKTDNDKATSACEECEVGEDTVIYDVAQALFNSAKRNKSFVDPVVFVKKMQYFGKNSSDNAEGTEQHYYDEYKRKRKYRWIGGPDVSAAFFIYDMFRKRYIKCIDVPSEKFLGCEGCHIVGYKEQVFMFGGEVMLGSGQWNLNFWVYDTIRDRWESKTKVKAFTHRIKKKTYVVLIGLPQGRRHFQSCICGPYLYIVGGTGAFRIIQDNMFWYNYIDNIWSTQLLLPCSASQIRCCGFNNQLLLFDMSSRCGYLFSNKLNTFVKLDFDDEQRLVSAFPKHFSLFTYNDRIYVKSYTLIEFELTPNKLAIRHVWSMGSTTIAHLVSQSDVMESVVCNDSVLTLYKCSQTKTTQVEAMSLLEKDKISVQILPSDMEDYHIDASTKLFTLQHHYKMVETDVYVNELTKINCDRLNVNMDSE